MTLKQRLAIIGAVVSLATASLVLPGLVGKPARLVDLVTLFASGVAAGASLVAVARSRRERSMPGDAGDTETNAH